MIQLFHALDPENFDHFSSRGNITISSISTADLKIEQKPLNDLEKKKLKALAEQDKFYRLKLVVAGSDGEKKTFLTSSKACTFLQSYLNDELIISFDHLSAVLGISHRPVLLPDQELKGTCDNFSDLELKNGFGDFYTTVNFKLIESAPSPDTASFVQKIEKEREAREKGETKDNRSFLAKYVSFF